MTQQQFIEQYTSLPEEEQREVADFVAFLRQRRKTSLMVRKATPLNLEKQPFIGMWKDREEMEDSTSWVQGTRKAEWGGK